jgi:hypothetical protein
MMIDLAHGPPIIHWQIHWFFNFTIHNNSGAPALNVFVESVGENHFASSTKLSKVNNLPPFKTIDLEAEAFQNIEGPASEADKILSQDVPKELKGITLRITYQDEDRNPMATIVQIKNGQIPLNDLNLPP